MRFSTEPTRELLFCTTAESEIRLQKYLQNAHGWKAVLARCAVNHPDRVFDHEGGFMRFWMWDSSKGPEHAVVEVLQELARILPEDQFRLIRITCDENEVEEAGNRKLFEHMQIEVIQAPRIVF